jgi:hypothetical protein
MDSASHSLGVFVFRRLLCAAVVFAAADLSGVNPRQSTIGAIRWDAYPKPRVFTHDGDSRSPVGTQNGAVGSPARYHFRLPFFAQEFSDHSVTIRAMSQANMDQEIAYAAKAGIDYFALGCDAVSAYLTTVSNSGGSAFSVLAAELADMNSQFPSPRPAPAGAIGSPTSMASPPAATGTTPRSRADPSS